MKKMQLSKKIKIRVGEERDIARKEIEQLNFAIIKANEENQNIMKEYKTIAKQNIKIKIKIDLLWSKIL